MRLFSQTQGRTAKPQPPRPNPVTFICSACEAVEHRPTPSLPEGWATETINDDISAYCGTCAIDLPQGSAQ